MAIDDEPRRSGRATKGQHTKDREDSAPAGKKGKAKGKKSKAEPEPEPEDEEEEEETIRCVCGEYEEEEDLARAMICCDKCEAWQHNSCMGLPEEWPENKKYFCEQCKPQDHKELLAAIKRGEKPWEMAKQRLEQARAEEIAAKKKGKKGGRKSNARSVEKQDTATAEPEEAPTSKKRKLEESPVPDAEIKTKKARSNNKKATNGAASAELEESEQQDEEMAEEPEPEAAAEPEPEPEAEVEAEPEPEPEAENPALIGVATDPKEIGDSSRSKIATNLVKAFTEQVTALTQSGDLSLSKGETAKPLGTKIALQVEHAVYYFKAGESGETGDAYKGQIRAILNNIKSNPDLVSRLINGRLGADKLANMAPKDMATEEQKQKDADEQSRLEKQHILVEENQGPRIRKTHKGDEYVDDSGQPAESATSKPVKPAVNTAAAQDAEMKSPTAAEKPTVMRKPSASTKGRPFGDSRRKSSTNFDIDKVWSGVQNSPTDADVPKLSETPHQGSPPLQTNTDADADVDRLLKDEENDNESQPYSPKEFNDPDIIWRGKVAGGSLGTFFTTAKYAAGCRPDVDNLSMTWDQLIPEEFKLHGRIQPSKADDYLCGLEYSNTTELVIISLAEPADTEGRKQFEKFFNYLKTKQRYGVVSQHSVPAIKDIYLLPMDVGTPLPSVMKALENQFPDPVTERCFLVPIVVKWTELPHNAERARSFFQNQSSQAAQSPSVGPPVAQTPMTPNEPHTLQFEPPRQPFPQNASSINGGGSIAYSTPPPPYTAHATIQPPPQTQSTAAVTAQRILGPEMAAYPAVMDLIAQVPTAGEHEMKIIKECVEENAEAGRSLTVLTQMLQQKHKDQKSNREQAAAAAAAAGTTTATASDQAQAPPQPGAPVTAET